MFFLLLLFFLFLILFSFPFLSTLFSLFLLSANVDLENFGYILENYLHTSLLSNCTIFYFMSIIRNRNSLGTNLVKILPLNWEATDIDCRNCFNYGNWLSASDKYYWWSAHCIFVRDKIMQLWLKIKCTSREWEMTKVMVSLLKGQLKRHEVNTFYA